MQQVQNMQNAHFQEQEHLQKQIWQEKNILLEHINGSIEQGRNAVHYHTQLLYPLQGICPRSSHSDTRKVYPSSSSMSSPQAMLPGKKCLHFSKWVTVNQ